MKRSSANINQINSFNGSIGTQLVAAPCYLLRPKVKNEKQIYLYITEDQTLNSPSLATNKTSS